MLDREEGTIKQQTPYQNSHLTPKNPTYNKAPERKNTYHR
jgi:hypothetical protein